MVGVVGKTPQLIEPLPHAIAQRCVEDEVLSKLDDPSPWLWCDLVLLGSVLNYSTGSYHGRKCASSEEEKDKVIKRSKACGVS